MNKARVAVTIAFIANGLGSGTFVARIPDYKKLIGLTNGQFGFALLAGTAGVLLALGPAGRLSAKYGSRIVTFVATAGSAFAFIGLGSIRNAAEFMLANFVWGFFQAMMDVGMNAHAIAIEHKYEKKFMGRFHASWSLGAFGGGFIGGLFSQRHLGMLINTAFIAAIVLIGTLAFRNWWLPSEIDQHPFHKEKRSRKRPPIFWILGFIGFCAAVGEGAASDWGGILSRSVFHATPFLSTVPYVLFCVAMVSGRFSGDALATKFSSRSILIATGLIAGIGLGSGLLAGSMYGIIFGWIALGAGVSVVIPTLFSMSGIIARERFTSQIAPAEAMAMVSGVTYAGFMAGPPIIGLLSSHISLRWAMLFPALLALVYSYISSRVMD